MHGTRGELAVGILFVLPGAVVRAAGLAAIATLLAFKLHRSPIEVVIVMATLGVVMQYLL